MVMHDDDDDAPGDLDDLRRSLEQRLANFDRRWTRCALRPCRRARRCIATGPICAVPYVTLSHEDQARAMAELRIALRDRLAQLDGE